MRSHHSTLSAAVDAAREAANDEGLPVYVWQIAHGYVVRDRAPRGLPYYDIKPEGWREHAADGGIVANVAF